MLKSFKLRLEELSDRVVPSVTEPTSSSEPDTSVTVTIVTSSDQVVDTSCLNHVSELLASTLDQNPSESAFEQLLLREFQVGLDRFVNNPFQPYLLQQYRSLGESLIEIEQQNNPFFADNNKPLSQVELKELEKLLQSTDEISKKRAAELIGRMKSAGIKFDGTNELEILKQIVRLAPRGQGPLLKAGIEKAIAGLQNLDEQRYQQYKLNREGRAPHDEAWTFRNGGDTALKRYELEKLLEKIKK